MGRANVVAMVCSALALAPASALADEEVIRRPPLAEPIFTETVTDIDG